MLTQKNIIAQIISINNHFSFKEGERFMTITPLFHNSGQFFSTFCSIMKGNANLILNPKIAFINFWYFVSKHRINWTLGMGSHINFLLSTSNKYKIALKAIVIGGMRLEADNQKKFEKKFNVKILKTYGLTETCSFATCDKYVSKNKVYGSSGTPIDANIIKIF
jgi:acyl-CoA synthetase (AMP-forming)/AMP-acid ligase II